MDQIEQIKKNSHPRWEHSKPWSLTHRHVHETILFGFILLAAVFAGVFLSIQDSDDGIPLLSLKEIATPTAVTVIEVPVRKLIDIDNGIYESYESMNQNGMQRRYSIDDESERNYTLLGAYESISASCLSISPLVSLLATCSHIGRVTLWSIEQKRVFVSVKGYGIPITDLSFSPDGSIVAAGSQDGKVTLLHTTDGSVLTELPRYSEEVLSVAYSPDGKYLSVGASGAGWIWELEGKNYDLVDYFLYPNEKVNDVAYSSDGNFIAFAVSDGNIWIRRASNGKLISRLAGNDDELLRISFSPLNTYLASGSDEGNVILWHIEQTKAKTPRISPLLELHHTDWINDLTFSPDEHQLIVAVHRSRLAIWQIPSGVLLSNFLDSGTGHSNGVAFSMDGEYFATSSLLGGIKIWNKSKP